MAKLRTNELPPEFSRWIDFYRHLQMYGHRFMSDYNFHTIEYQHELRFDKMNPEISGIREMILYRIDKSFLYGKALEELENNIMSSEETERLIHYVDSKHIPLLEFPIIRNSFRKLRYITK